MVAIALAGVAWLVAIVSYQHAYRPPPAPDHVQAEGIAITHETLSVLAQSAFGRSGRGQIICAEITELLEEERILFAPMHRTRGLTWGPILGRKTVYIKVLSMADGRFLHQRPEDLIEGLVHEAVHSIKNTRRRISIEEEYDCFAAGVEAGLIVAGHPVPAVLGIEGKPIAEFVHGAYPDARHDPGYTPVGASLEWLLKRVGAVSPNPPESP